MSELIIVVDATCAPCSALGREIELIPGIRMIGATSAEAQRLGVGGVAPCVVETTTAGTPRVRVGWSMRLRLARHLGWRRADQWVTLLLAETRARSARDGASRRTVVTAALLGALGAAVGAAPAAAASSSVNWRTLTEAELAAAIARYRSRTSRAASATTGYLVGRGDSRAHALVLRGGDLLMVPVVRADLAFVLKCRDHTLVYEDLDGTILAQLTASTASGKKHVVSGGAAATDARPVSITRFAKCFADCLGGEVDFGCIWDCATGDMIGCAVCAGYAGIVCALRCRKYF